MSKIFAYIPSAYKVGKTYTAIPDDGNGDFTFSRPAAADRTDANGGTELMPINTPRIDYSDDGCPKLILDNRLSERCGGSVINVDANSCVWDLELEAREEGTTVRRTQMSSATDNYLIIGYGSSSNSIFFSVYNGVTSSDLVFNYSDITRLRKLTMLKNGSEQIAKVDNVIVGYTDLSPTVEDMVVMDYSLNGMIYYMDGKTRNNTVDDDVTTFDSTATSWAQVVKNISNLFTER